MIRLVGQRAHIRDAYIEQMIRIAGMIGDAAPDVGALLDQADADIVRRLTQ